MRKNKTLLQRIRLGLCVTTLALSLTACGSGAEDEKQSSDDAVQETSSEEVKETPTEQPSETEPVVGSQSFVAEDQYVKTLGRTYFDGNCRWMAQSASGIEFTFTGTKCAITVQGDAGVLSGSNRTRIAVYVNGERVVDDMINKIMETYQVFSAEEAQEVTVRVVKLSESANSVCGVSKIEVDGTAIAPTPEKDLKIEFIGDSITCGYGVDDEDRNHHFSTETEDATRTYAYHTAKLLDADYSFVSFSGYGIVSGYNTGNDEPLSTSTVPQYYSSFGFSYSNFGNRLVASEIVWDHSSFIPDVVVINLGTNDASWTKGKADRIEQFTEGYVTFLQQVRAANPNAQIVCTLGIMGADLFPAIEDAVQRYQDQTGDTAVSTMKFDMQQEADGIAADWHPTEKTHEKAAQKLAEKLKEVLELE